MSNRLKLLRERAARPRRTVEVQLDGEVWQQIEAVEDELDRLDDPNAKVADRRLSTKNNAARIAELKAAGDELRKAAAETTVYVVLEGLPDTTWLALKRQHPPLPEPDTKPLVTDGYGLTMRFNIDTLRRPLVRACVVGHREFDAADAELLTVWPADDYLDWLLDFITTAQMKRLSDAAYALCERDDAAPLPRTPSATRTSADG